MSDLISREALKKALEEDMKYGGVKIHEFDKGYDLGIKTAIEMLDNAPPVSLQDIYQEGHYDGHLEGYTKAINEERPTGKWVFGGFCVTTTRYICNQCTIPNLEKTNFCPNCGADMRKEADNEKIS